MLSRTRRNPNAMTYPPGSLEAKLVVEPPGVTRGQDTTLRALVPDSPFDGALHWNGDGWEGDVMEPDERDWYNRNVLPAFRFLDLFLKRLQGPEQRPEHDGAGSGGTRG